MKDLSNPGVPYTKMWLFECSFMHKNIISLKHLHTKINLLVQTFGKKLDKKLKKAWI